ncbi:putative glycoside hydrolase [Vibrio methylphosphonaticus]|uniref:putative glycoside hydrolase n=1 Tax=Vibrio methylphosphonaticus TaxID=2946866 RepID=UPI00202A22EF|nr:putative glycoside hydrolase [Vibrio methylphosphonaticus]MCL9774053.1 hypothetical protein [Vibrio methylphosphonaticus]
MMINKTKALFVSGLSLTALAGCLDDPYVYPNDQVKPPVVTPPDSITLYGKDSDDRFKLAVVDKDSIEADVDANGHVSQGNIRTQPISNEENGPLLVTITEDGQGARIQSTSVTNAAVDLDFSAELTALEFDVRVLDKPDTANSVKLHTQSEYQVDDDKNVDITSALMALSSMPPQTMMVPFSCFDGQDLNEVTTPFALASDSNLKFEISNIHLTEYDIDPAEKPQALECDNKSNPVDLHEWRIFVQDIPDSWDPAGWGQTITAWATDGNIQQEWQHDHIYITYDGIGAGENGGLVLAVTNLDTLTDDERRDISAFIDGGHLEFMLKVDSYGSHPTKRLQVQMETNFGNGTPQYLDAGFAEGEWKQVRIPLAALLKNEDGTLNVNAIRNIEKPLSILPEWVENQDTLEGMWIRVGSVKLAF